MPTHLPAGPGNRQRRRPRVRPGRGDRRPARGPEGAARRDRRGDRAAAAGAGHGAGRRGRPGAGGPGRDAAPGRSPAGRHPDERCRAQRARQRSADGAPDPGGLGPRDPRRGSPRGLARWGAFAIHSMSLPCGTRSRTSTPSSAADRSADRGHRAPRGGHGCPHGGMTQDGSARLHPPQGPVVRLRRREGPLSEYAVIQTQFRDAAVRRLRQGLGGRWAEGTLRPYAGVSPRAPRSRHPPAGGGPDRRGQARGRPDEPSLVDRRATGEGARRVNASPRA